MGREDRDGDGERQNGRESGGRKDGGRKDGEMQEEMGGLKREELEIFSYQ